MVKEIQESQMKWHNHVERMLTECLPQQAYFYHPTERWSIEHLKTSCPNG